MAGRIVNPCALRTTLSTLSNPHRAGNLTSAAVTSIRPVANYPTHHQQRHSSHSPLGSPPTNSRKKITIDTLRTLHKKNEPITMLTAHDFPSAHVADHAGMDMILVGDSLAMVALGMEDTSEVLLEEMILHCRSVSRATKAAFTVCAPHFQTTSQQMSMC